MTSYRLRLGALAVVAWAGPSAALANVEGVWLDKDGCAMRIQACGDAMCGTKHMMKGDDAGCTRGCVKKGSEYALIIKDKVYTLKTASDEMKTQLDKLAGHRASIVGEQDGDTIQVTSARVAK